MKYCKNCKTKTERHARGQCKLCVCRAGAAWKAANPEMGKASNAAYRAANQERIRANRAAYRDSNKEAIRARQAARRAANPEKMRAYSAAYAAANPEARRTYEANRRARKRNAEGSHTAADVNTLFTLQKGKCACCKTSIKDGCHVDHIMPLVKCGSNDKYNLQLLCPTCNMSKNAKDPIEFMQSRGFLL